MRLKTAMNPAMPQSSASGVKRAWPAARGQGRHTRRTRSCQLPATRSVVLGSAFRSMFTEFENFTVFKPGDVSRAALDTLLDQVIAWSTALAPLRQPAAALA
jgi:hypothetical protein